MSIEMDAGAGAGVSRAPFTAANVEAEAVEPDPAEDWLMIFTTLIGVLAASSLGVWVYLG